MAEEASSRFPKTRWTQVLELGSASAPIRQRAFEQLCQIYWKPLYSYARRRGLSVHDAEDLTQGFLTRLIARGEINHLDPERGRLRSFLKASFQNYMADEDRRSSRQKRGGGSIEYLDIDAAERSYNRHLSNSDGPEKAFDQQWARIVLKRALLALRAKFEARDRVGTLRELEIYLGPDNSAPPYAVVAARLGQSENTVAAAVARMRQEFGALLRQEIAETLGPGQDVDEELRYLLSIVS